MEHQVSPLILTNCVPATITEKEAEKSQRCPKTLQNLCSGVCCVVVCLINRFSTERGTKAKKMRERVHERVLGSQLSLMFSEQNSTTRGTDWFGEAMQYLRRMERGVRCADNLA